MAPPAFGEATALSIALALLFLFVMLALFVGGVIVLVKLVRAVFSMPAPAVHEVPAQASTDAASVAVGAAELRPRAATVSDCERDCAGEGPARLALWRSRELMRLGVEPVTAVEAALCGVDAARVRSLVARGCEPALAVAILLPDAKGDRLARSPAEGADGRSPTRPHTGASPDGVHASERS